MFAELMIATRKTKSLVKETGFIFKKAILNSFKCII